MEHAETLHFSPHSHYNSGRNYKYYSTLFPLKWITITIISPSVHLHEKCRMQIVIFQTLRYAVDFFKCIFQFFALGVFHIELIFIFFLRRKHAAVMPQQSWVLSSSAPSVVQIRQTIEGKSEQCYILAFSYILILFSSILYAGVTTIWPWSLFVFHHRSTEIKYLISSQSGSCRNIALNKVKTHLFLKYS